MAPATVQHRMNRRVLPTLALLCICVFTTAAQSAESSAPVWHQCVNDMSDARWAPGACVLTDGTHAVIAGGFSYDAGGCVSSIDIYDEHTNSFRLSKARLTYPRDFPQANLLSDGKVLFCGGFSDVWASMNAADIYDPVTDICILAKGKMHQHRELMTSAHLPDGRIIFIGGLDLWARGTVATAEIYDPATQEFTWSKGYLHQDRFGHASCLLADGRVFIVGGTHWNLHRRESKVLDSAEIYDPKNDQFTLCAGHLAVARDRPTANLLPDGKVLVYGGQSTGGASVTTAEIYDPATDSFSTMPIPAQTPRMAHSSVTLANGEVLASGGWDADIKATTSSSVLVDSAINQVIDLAPLPFASHDAAMVIFPDNAVLVAGGKTVVNGHEGSTAQGALMRF
jgi:hypothetical protein